MVNGIVSLNSLSIFSLLVYRNARDFCVLILYFHVDVGNLISGSSAFSKSSLNIWKFMVYVPLKPGLENFEHYFASL